MAFPSPLAEGECFGFLGPNGAGKTTTVRMIHCVSPITAGEISVMGEPAHIDNRAIKMMTGVVPQEITLDRDLTVYENLRVFAYFFDIPGVEARRRIDELLAFVELEAKRNAKISDLSTGMKRRLLIARALLNKPRLIIADEPTTGPRPAGAAPDLAAAQASQAAGDDPDPHHPVYGRSAAAL